MGSAGWWDEALDVGAAELADTLRYALHEDYDDADDESLDEALGDMLESMSAAEAVNFTQALKQIRRTAGSVAADPTLRSLAGTAAPVAAGALGSLIGGPAGGAVASNLGTAAARALTGPRHNGLGGAGFPTRSPAPATAGGSAAAAQGLVLTQQPDVLSSLLALSLGQHGARSVNGVPVATVMNMLSSIFGQAAADADELMYLDGTAAAEGFSDAEDLGYPTVADDLPTGRELYTALLDADNYELADAMEST